MQGTLGSAGKLAMLVPLILQLVLKGAMKKLWFFFNTVQLASTFTEFNLVKSPANVTLIKKAYDKIVNLKILPDGFIDQLIANVGIDKKIEKPRDDVIDLTEFKSTTDTVDNTDQELTIKTPESVAEDTHKNGRRVLEVKTVAPEQVTKNRIKYAAIVLSVVSIFVAIFIFRNQIYPRLPNIV